MKSRNKGYSKIRNSKPASRRLKIVSYSCLVIGIASFLGITQMRYFDNTIDGFDFYFISSLVGLLLCVPFYILIHRTVPELKNGIKVNKQWTANLFGLGFGFFFLTPAVASYMNRTYFINKNNCSNYKVIQKGTSSRRPHHYYLFVILNNHKERLDILKTQWDNVEEGQDVRLCIQKGIFGYDNIKIEE